MMAQEHLLGTIFFITTTEHCIDVFTGRSWLQLNQIISVSEQAPVTKPLLPLKNLC